MFSMFDVAVVAVARLLLWRGKCLISSALCGRVSSSTLCK